MSDINRIFEKTGYKLFLDESAKGVRGEERFLYNEFRGKHGQVYLYSPIQLIAQAYRGTGKNPTKFVKTKGYKVVQDAEDLVAFLFPVSDFDEIAKRLQLTKKRKVSKKQISGLKRGTEPSPNVA